MRFVMFDMFQVGFKPPSATTMRRTSHEGPAIVLKQTSFLSLYKPFAYTCVSVPTFDHKNKNDISKDDLVLQKITFLV